ncbi:MAG: hypothetical protein ACYC25_11990, partial [Paludibacter sp.]
SLWKQRIASGDLFTATEEDREITYQKDDWSKPSVVKECVEGNVEGCNGYLFLKAAKLHHRFIHKNVLPSIGIL